jgi:mRNA-degrading endonuclease YafQ of YafQ-DinJ toxin-antitoxin module
MKYQYRAVEKFWRNFYKLRSEQKESVRRAWQVFKRDPFHPSLRSHEIIELSARANHTIYSAVIEADLRVIFRIDASWATSLDVGTHRIYRG